MKKFKFFFFSSPLFCALFATAQDFHVKLDWQPNPEVFILPAKSVAQPTFTNAAHQSEFGLLPFYTKSVPINVAGDVSVEIINPVFSASATLDKKSLQFIKEEVEAKGELSVYRKLPNAFLSVLPFRKNKTTGQIEKLESFTLRMRITVKPQTRAAHGYASSSVLASGDWYKIAVNSEGIYKLDFNFVKNILGANPNNFSFNTLAVFGNGGGMVPDHNSVARFDDLVENPTMIVDNNGNNRMDEGDYLLFYAQPPDGWTFDAASQTFKHTKNLYTDKTFYFVTTTSGTGKRATVAASAGTPNKTITDFDERYFHESDEYNMLVSGKEWLGDKMTSYANSKSFSLNFPNIIISVPVKFTSYIAGVTNRPQGSTTVVNVNGQNIMSQNESGIPLSGYPDGYTPNISTANFTANSSQLNILYTTTIHNDPSGSGAVYINYFELNLKRALSLSGNAMSFRNISSTGAGSISQFNLNNASSVTKVWDVTNIGDIREMPANLSGSQLSFVTATDSLKEFVAFNYNASFSAPEFVSKIANQNLHAIGEPDMVIVTHEDFESPSNELANFHRTADNLSVSVVKLSQVYNEFGGGRPDISAIRDFMRMLYARAGNDTSKMPRYLLLMGDGSHDPKGRIAGSNNFIPTYQSYESRNQIDSYTSDDFFGLLDDNEGGNITSSAQLLDIGVGRLPVGSEQEAWDMVNKIKNYKNPVPDASCVQLNGNKSWRNILTFIADDLDEGGSVFGTYSDTLANKTRRYNPAYNYEKIYMDAYKQLSTPAGPRYPDVNTAILNRVNAGALVINWVGHGGETNWGHERIFNMADIIPLENKEKLPLFITATCEFSRYDRPDRTAGEWIVVNGKGGGIASITTVRLVYQHANEQIASATFDALFQNYEGRYPRLGEVIMRAKNAIGNSVNNRKFTLLGDPALTLNYPRYDVATTQINSKPITQDTLKALSHVTIKGEVRDDNGNKLTSFNGVVYPLVYDKIATQRTMGNDNPSDVFNFSVYKNILFQGKASVTNGEFSFSFIVPKDINYQYGFGRISYYADNENNLDAHGYTDSIMIGGSADSFRADGAGPQIDIYMNDEKFAFGGTTNADPMLLVHLFDSSGINTVGNGIGHDLTATLDANTQNMVVLNQFYESELDNYQKGTVKYPYSKLSEGRHTLKIKAWDIHNNSSEDYTEFVVANNAKLALSHVYNYPNPFTTHTEFMFEHNRCCDDLSVSIQIFTVSGKLVKSIVQQVYSTGYRVDNIEWNGLDDYGDPIGKGVYVYKINVRDSEGQSAHKFEKLVVLR